MNAIANDPQPQAPAAGPVAQLPADAVRVGDAIRVADAVQQACYRLVYTRASIYPYLLTLPSHRPGLRVDIVLDGNIYTTQWALADLIDLHGKVLTDRIRGDLPDAVLSGHRAAGTA